MRMRGIAVDYDQLLDGPSSSVYDDLIEHVLGTLPTLWQKAYRKMAQSPTSIHQFQHRGFDFLFDRASELRAKGIVPEERAVEDRVIVVYGRSMPPPEPNGNGSKRNLLGNAAAQFGEDSSRPYLPGSVLGGAFEISLYPQYRDLDNEHSADARLYRSMKKHCFEHPGTFCFSRPIYTTRSWCPTAVEHGLLRPDGDFWVHTFKNTPAEPRLMNLVRTGRKVFSSPASAD
jgi:hypothetical protein